MSLPPIQLEASWAEALKNEWSKGYLKELAKFVAQERLEAVVYPTKENVFSAFNATPYNATKVVIMGQDPYHGENQAHGLSFSVSEGVRQPPSLKNIFKELEEDCKIPFSDRSCLMGWAKQGVLLLNATLTVRAKSPASHQKKGWEKFTDAVVEALCQRSDPVIFVLWGKSAQEKCRTILSKTTQRHHVLSAAHPSPYSAYSGFFGCRHFSKINDLLKRQGKEPIDWAK